MRGADRRAMYDSLRRDGFGLIAEIKRASPSAGPLRPDLDPLELAREYQDAGAHGLSILTCGPWFRGSPDDLRRVREAVEIPVLCKDFLVEPFQVIEAAAAGADCVLLIAAALDDQELRTMSDLAAELGLEVLYEAHDRAEIDRLTRLRPALLGVNSRNLRTMQVDREAAWALGQDLPPGVCGVFESGIREAADLPRARAAGYHAVLVGESLLRAERPGDAVRALLGGVA